MTKAGAMHAFWSSFGMPAYEESCVPPDAVMPYITYDFAADSFGGECSLTATIWYRSTSWTKANVKSEEIARGIGYSGKLLPCDGGKIWIRRGRPFERSLREDSDSGVRRKVVNITAAYLTNV